MDVPEVQLFGQLDVDVPRVFDFVPETFQGRVQPRRAHRRGAHVHAAAFLPQVKRNAQYPDPLHHTPGRNSCQTPGPPSYRIPQRKAVGPAGNLLRVLVSFGTGSLSKRRSFPRKRESASQTFGNALWTDSLFRGNDDALQCPFLAIDTSSGFTK